MSQIEQLIISLSLIVAAMLIVGGGYLIVKKKSPSKKAKTMKDMSVTEGLVQKMPPYLVHQ